MIIKELNSKVKEDLRKYFEDRDYIVVSVPKDEPIRLYVVKANRTLETVVRLFSPEGEDRDKLGKVVMGTLLLTSLVKHATEQKISLEIKTGEKRYYAEADGKGRVRCFMENAFSETKTLTVVRELGLGKPYTSIVPLVSEDIGESMNFYFYQSEQTPSVVGFVLKEADGKPEYAVGYMIQSMGGAKEEVWEKLRGRTLQIGNDSLAIKKARPEEVAEEILRGFKPMLVGLKEVEYYCPCNEDIARLGAFSIPEEERKEIFETEGMIELTCKFCGRVYRFSEEDLKKGYSE